MCGRVRDVWGQLIVVGCYSAVLILYSILPTLALFFVVDGAPSLFEFQPLSVRSEQKCQIYNKIIRRNSYFSNFWHETRVLFGFKHSCLVDT